MAQEFIGRDLMSHPWWARCPHGCGWEARGEKGSAAAYRAQEAHVVDCPDRPGPEPPRVAPPPVRPV